VNLAVLAPLWLALILAFILLAAAAQDATRLKISNVTVVLVIAAAIVAAVVVGPTFGLWQNLAVFAVLLAIGTPLFAAGKLGGGDVKLLAAVGLWFDIEGAGKMLLAVALSGGALAVLILAARTLKWSDGARRRVVVLQPRSGIPYGVAIAFGTLIAMALQR
jgi:prepilin peptidase CpaA